MDLVIEILKWVALVFLAGVIGQLGKSLTLRILAARRKRREHRAGAAASPDDAPATGATGHGEPRKASASGSPAAIRGGESPDEKKPAKATAKAWKKAAKAEAKRRKKAAAPD